MGGGVPWWMALDGGSHRWLMDDDDIRTPRKRNGTMSSNLFTSHSNFTLGSVSNKYYYNIDFPRGHIALKSYNAEVVDEPGFPVPLHETYLHHWIVVRYYQPKGAEISQDNAGSSFHQSDIIIAGNKGVYDPPTDVPDPYGIEVGNEAEIPVGYEERWLLNVHAIDTRGAEDKLGCTECRLCGGLKCCYDEMQCRLIKGFEGAKRSLYMRYTVKWVDWDDSIVPVIIYILDVTDTWKRTNESTGLGKRHDCLVEYDIEPCSTGMAMDSCTDTKRVSLSLPTGGDVVYGVAHQHTGGVGSTLYGEDGRVICSSIPTYGEGKVREMRQDIL
ncbi:unnamed protein product [Ilex paraguariensis]|uniref:Stress up-regulated Nod 19 n=1 Tax=Ilex paraguariensis TaxID=185542 RepID=A0ABC8V0L1_9AQUA